VAEPEAELPILDEGVLAELTASVTGDHDFVKELIATYLADGAAQIEAIGAAVASDDAAALVRPAHTLKSSSATVGAQRLAATARRLEMSGRSGALDATVAADVAVAQADWTAAVAALREWIARGARA